MCCCVGAMCWAACSEDRPLLERFRILCVTCLVLDSNFALIDSRTAFVLATRPVNQCYEEHGYSSHNVLTGTFLVSVMISILGMVWHSRVVCNEVTEPMLHSVNRFAHGLIAWTFITVILEVLFYEPHPPPECTALTTTATPVADEAFSEYGYEVGVVILWLVWVTSAVTAAFLAKRLTGNLAAATEELRNTSAASNGGVGNAGDPCGMATIVGLPLDSNQAQVATVAGSVAGVAAPDSAPSPGVPAGMEGVAMGMPVQGVPAPNPSGGKVVDP